MIHNIRRTTGQVSSRAQNSAERVARIVSATEETERLERKADRARLADGFSDVRVLLVGFDYDILFDIRQKLRSIGVAAAASAPSVKQLDDAADMRLGFTHILVNLDKFQDVEDGVDALIAFRSKSPDLIVVTFSEEVTGDDFGTERSPVCDATLRLPISKERLAAGLRTAFLNHSDGHVKNLMA